MLAFFCELFVLTHIPLPQPMYLLSLMVWFHITSHYYYPLHCLLSWPFHCVQFVLNSFPSADLFFLSQRPKSKRSGKNLNLLVFGHLFNLNYYLYVSKQYHLPSMWYIWRLYYPYHMKHHWKQFSRWTFKYVHHCSINIWPEKSEFIQTQDNKEKIMYTSKANLSEEKRKKKLTLTEDFPRQVFLYMLSSLIDAN